MKKDPVVIAWSISLLGVGILSIITGVCNIVGIELPDASVRIIGIADLVGAVVLASTSVRLWLNKKNNKE